MLLEKVVVAFPSKSMSGIDEKVFETVADEEFLEVINKPDGCLVITCNANLRGYKPITLAVFKHWIYWERQTKETKNKKLHV